MKLLNNFDILVNLLETKTIIIVDSMNNLDIWIGKFFLFHIDFMIPPVFFYNANENMLSLI
jgi:hypothetical protein